MGSEIEDPNLADLPDEAYEEVGEEGLNVPQLELRIRAKREQAMQDAGLLSPPGPDEPLEEPDEEPKELEEPEPLEPQEPEEPEGEADDEEIFFARYKTREQEERGKAEQSGSGRDDRPPLSRTGRVAAAARAGGAGRAAVRFSGLERVGGRDRRHRGRGAGRARGTAQRRDPGLRHLPGPLGGRTRPAGHRARLQQRRAAASRDTTCTSRRLAADRGAEGPDGGDRGPEGACDD